MNVLMPQLGETVAEGKITKWFKSAGDTVKPGDNLFEIETDKVSMEVPSTEAGVLSEIRVAGRRSRAGRRRRRRDRRSGFGGCGAPGTAAAKPAAAPAPKRLRRPPPAHRLRGEPAPAPAAKPQPPIKLDPFFEVRTPDTQFRPGATVRAA